MATKTNKKITGDSGIIEALRPKYLSASFLSYAPINQLVGGRTAHANTTLTIPANTSHLCPFLIPEGRSVDSMKVTVSTLQAAKTITPFIFSMDNDNLPDVLLAVGDGTGNSAATTGTKTMPFASSWVSNGEMVWAGYWSDSSSVAINAYDVSDLPYIPIFGVDNSYVSSGALSVSYLSHILGDTYANGVAPTLTGGLLSALGTDAPLISLTTS